MGWRRCALDQYAAAAWAAEKEADDGDDGDGGVLQRVERATAAAAAAAADVTDAGHQKASLLVPAGGCCNDTGNWDNFIDGGNTASLQQLGRLLCTLSCGLFVKECKGRCQRRHVGEICTGENKHAYALRVHTKHRMLTSRCLDKV